MRINIYFKGEWDIKLKTVAKNEHILKTMSATILEYDDAQP